MPDVLDRRLMMMYLNFYPRCLCSTVALKVVPDFFLSDKMVESGTTYGSGYRMVFNLESILNYLQLPYFRSADLLLSGEFKLLTVPNL